APHLPAPRPPPLASGRPAPPRSERLVDGVDEGAVARVLPARPGLVHHVAKGQLGVGVREPERSARAEVAEAPGAGAHRALALRQLEPQPETRRPAEDDVGPG